MKILSLFDGMSCGAIAMINAGIEMESYDAYEIDKYAIKTSHYNFPAIKHHGDVFKADFTQYENVDYLVGGSPCTYWSIAQKNNRETEASGLGWELFSQYLRALHEAKPRYFIYENNKSMSKEIRASIDKAFGFDAVGINSALVSAQNRQRLYWVGSRNADGTYSKVEVKQPEDKGILLKDVLEYGESLQGEKGYCLTASYNGACAWNTIERGQRSMAAEPVAECVSSRGRYLDTGRRNAKSEAGTEQRFEARGGGKTNALTTVQKDNMVAEPVRVGDLPSKAGKISGSQATRIYDIDGKSINLVANGGGQGAKTGLYAIPVPYQCAELSDEYYHGDEDGQLFGKIECDNSSNNKGQPAQGTRIYCTDCKSICLDGDSRKHIVDTFTIPTEFNNDVPIKAVSCADGKTYPVYQVLNGQITIKDKQYPIKLQDGYYIIRKLTVTECKRLQTVPEWYDFSVVSDCQAYKMLGNGWTCDVITHLINATKQEKKNAEIHKSRKNH